jgi:hypothetical protein
VAIRDVHRGPNDHLGEQGCDGANNVGSTPDILYREEAGAKAILCLETVAKQLQFKEAALLAQETAAAKEEGKTQAMLFAMLQDQHAKQIAQMEATNKTNMDAMMEQMNTLVAAGRAQHAHQLDKENTPPGKNVIPPGGGNQAKKPRQKKALYPNCKCFVLHKPASCFELEANKASRYPGWKSIFAVPATA